MSEIVQRSAVYSSEVDSDSSIYTVSNVCGLNIP